MQDNIAVLARALRAQEHGPPGAAEADRLVQMRQRLDAAAQGDVAKLEECVRADNVDEADEDGATCLFAAAFHGQLTVLSHLLAKGASVNHESFHGTTPLWSAINNEQDAAVRLLIDAGADLSKTRGNIVIPEWVAHYAAEKQPGASAVRATGPDTAALHQIPPPQYHAAPSHFEAPPPPPQPRVQQQQQQDLVPVVELWSVEAVCRFFRSLGADDTDCHTLRREKIDGEALALLSDGDLRELRLPMGVRVKAAAFVRGLQQQQQQHHHHHHDNHSK